ncbi:MAG: Uncharacterised protein [Flavobacteriaceae bacterium]|nr:MAG: Uncharacterised protein [Flavobacteriaceae bacterium]
MDDPVGRSDISLNNSGRTIQPNTHTDLIDVKGQRKVIHSAGGLGLKIACHKIPIFFLTHHHMIEQELS